MAESSPAEEHDGKSEITKFEELGTQNIVDQTIVNTLTRKMGLTNLTEVQRRTINESLKGDDVIAQAKTGTGKTLAFLIPILQNIISKDPELARPAYGRRGPRTTADDIRALIISPTRELAEQIAVEASRVTQGTGLIVQTAVGGTQKRLGLRNIQTQGCHILVGTPGRLKDILSDTYSGVKAPDLSALVFDEADRLLEAGFWPEIMEIMRLLPSRQEQDRQTMMFSATVPQEVVGIVRQTLKPGFLYVKCVQDNEDPTHPNVKQRIVRLNGMENSLPTLTELCAREIEASKQPEGKPFKAIVYFNGTAEVKLAHSAFSMFKKPGQDADAFGPLGGGHPWHPTRILEIHSKLSQGERTRAAEAFRRCESGILLSSDVTARGLDFPNVTHVIQMGLPQSRDQYIHRVGRTARAGKEGEGWLILNPLEADEAPSRLRRLPIEKDDTLEIAKLDMTKGAQVGRNAGELLKMYQDSLRKVSSAEKKDVYRAQLGIHQWVGRKNTLIEYMNNLARFGWGMPDAPMLSPMLAQKLGIARVPGVNIGHDEERSMDSGRDRYGGVSRGGSRGGYGGGGFGGGREGGGGRGGRDAFGDRGSSSGGRDAFGDRGSPGGGRDAFGDRSGGFSAGRRSSYGGGGSRYGSRGGDRESSYGGDRYSKSFES